MMISSSIVIYLMTFMVSLLLIQLASMCSIKKDDHYSKIYSKKLIEKVLMIFACILPCLLAGLRADYVGKDISVYVTNNFNMAINHSMDLFTYFNKTGLEFFFALIVYICAKYGNIHILYFMIELLTIVPIMVLLYHNKNKISMTFGMAIFYFLFFNLSLCVMRQSIAMSFLILSYDYLNKINYKKAILFSIIACLSHNSALIMVLIYLFIYLAGRSKYQKQIYWGFGIVLILIFYYYNNLISIAMSLVSHISTRYAFYIDYYASKTKIWSQVPATDLVCKSTLILLTYLILKTTKKVNNENNTLFIMTLIGRYFVIFTAVFYESMRLAFYFDFFLILYIPLALTAFKKTVINKIIINIVFIIPAVIYWYYFIMIVGAYGTNIYSFYWH